MPSEVWSRKGGRRRIDKIADCQSEDELAGFVAQCGNTLTNAESEAVARHRAGMRLIAERKRNRAGL